MSSASSPVPKDHPLMVAWRAYLSTEDFANTRRWVDEGDESAVDGSLWAVFEQGWRAAGGLLPFEDRPRLEWLERFAWLSHPDVMQTIAEDPSVIISVQRGIRELMHKVHFWRDGEAAQAHAANRYEAALRGVLATWDAEDQQDGDNHVVLERAITAARAALTGAGPAGSETPDAPGGTR